MKTKVNKKSPNTTELRIVCPSEFPRTYTSEQVQNLILQFAGELGQRSGQYLPTIQPARDFIEKHNI